MQKNIIVAVIGLLVGLIAGFIFANKYSHPASVGTGLAGVQPAPPFQGQEVDSVVVKDQSPQGGMMPEVSEKLQKAGDEPNNFDAQAEAGDMFLRIRNFPRALEYFEAANKLKPDDRELVVKIGNTYFDAGQFENAELWYLKALEKQPADVNVRTDLGITFVERKAPDLDRAIKEFRTSLETDPKHAATLYNLAVAYYKKGDKAQAVSTMKSLEQADPQSDLLLKLKEILN